MKFCCILPSGNSPEDTWCRWHFCKKYSFYSTSCGEAERAAGDSSTFVNNNIIHSPAALDTALQSVAVISCSLYIPLHTHLSVAQLHILRDQQPSPFIIVGDFNSHKFISADELCYFKMVLIPIYIQVIVHMLLSIPLSRVQLFSLIFLGGCILWSIVCLTEYLEYNPICLTELPASYTF